MTPEDRASELTDDITSGRRVQCPGCRKFYIRGSVHFLSNCGSGPRPARVADALRHVEAATRLIPDDNEHLAARLALSVAVEELNRLTPEHKRLRVVRHG